MTACSSTDTGLYTLFLDGDFKQTVYGSCFCNATQCVCLLGAYCESLNIQVCLVQEQHKCCDNYQPQHGFKLPQQCFKHVFVACKKDIPAEILSCNLPAMLSEDKQLVISGLCHILRMLIKEKTINPDTKLLRLLGHKKFCLKAASEVSSRTRLCEVLGPAVIDDWLSNTKERNIEDIPEAIRQYETLLNQPIAIHNRDKQQRVVLKRLTESISTASDAKSSQPQEKISKLDKTSSKKKVVVRTNDLPPLEHVFAEGVEMTLSDLAILPFVNCYIMFCVKRLHKLKSAIPLTLLWYHRMQSIPKVFHSAKSCDVVCLDAKELSNQSEDIFQSGKHKILKLGQEKELDSYKNLKKKELDKTLRRDLPGILRRVDPLVSVTFKQFHSASIGLPWSSFPSDIHPATGELSTKRALRKCHQIENLVHAVKSICHDGDVVVDFCAGGGHVGIVLAHLLSKCKVIILDNKEESLHRARSRIQSLGLLNVTVYQCNLENYRGRCDVGVALHACGVATDMVLQKCMRESSSFVISPCCYGKIQNTDSIQYPLSRFFRQLLISYEEFVLLGHGGDQTSWDFDQEKPKQGKHCMGLIDNDRVTAAKEIGYETAVYTLQPHDCSPKNNLIIGIVAHRAKSSGRFLFNNQ